MKGQEGYRELWGTIGLITVVVLGDLAAQYGATHAASNMRPLYLGLGLLSGAATVVVVGRLRRATSHQVPVAPEVKVRIAEHRRLYTCALLLAILGPLVVGNIVHLNPWSGLIIAVAGFGVVAATGKRAAEGAVMLVRLFGMLLLVVGIGVVMVSLMRQFGFGVPYRP